MKKTRYYPNREEVITQEQDEARREVEVIHSKGAVSRGMEIVIIFQSDRDV